jgi:signal transduction histidine kinase/CheY-like chemotaxis protein
LHSIADLTANPAPCQRRFAQGKPALLRSAAGKKGMRQTPGQSSAKPLAPDMTMLLRKYRILTLLLSLALVQACGGGKKTVPKAEHGILDLTKYDFAADGPVALDGKWEFYFGKFLAPSVFKTATPKPIHPDVYIPVPDSWNHHGFAAAGFATYRLRIRLPAERSPEFLSLRLDTAGTAYTLFVNGKETVSAGKPGTSAETSQGSYKVILVPVQAERGEIELVFHIANFLHRSGGLWFSHRLGTHEQITRLREKGLFTDFVLLGALFIIGFYHISLFLNRRREIAVLYFGLFCLAVAFRVPFMGEFFLTQFFPDFPLPLQLRLEYATTYVTPIFFLSFLAHTYAQKTRKFIFYYSRIVPALFLVTLFVMAPIGFTRLVGWYYIFLGTCVVWAMAVIFTAVAHREENALASLFPFLILAATLVNDVLFSLEYIYTTTILPYGLIFFVFVQATLLSRKFYHAFSLSENLSASLIATNRDLTELKESLEQKVTERTEVLSEKNHELAQAIHTREKFLSIMAHDLRSPMVGMARVFDAVTEGSVKLEEKMLLTLAKTAHESVDLLENMLSWALSQKNELKTFPDDFDLRKIFGKVANLFEHMAAEKNIRLTANLDENLWIHADASMIETVLRNLIGNAFKFTPMGGEILVLARANGDWVRIEISDSGRGVTAEKLATLFALASGGAKAAPAANEGTGLGLVICKEFVEVNGGTIGAFNKPDRGCCFWFEMPRGIGHNEESAVKTRNLAGLKALIVEDNTLHLRLIEGVVAELGISAEMSTDGAAAWLLLQKKTFDFVLLDGQLPGIDGFTLAAKIAALPQRPRVIFHSSLSEMEIRQRAAAEHYDAMLPKPLEATTLAATLQRFYGKQ